MKNIQNKLIALLFVAFAFPYPGSSQDSLTNGLKYGVYRNYPPISITKEKLNEAHTIIDLNRHYKSSWVREYLSVEILTSYNGKIRKAVSKNETLSQEQKDFMNIADPGKDIVVRVQYIPENTLTHNDVKEIKFTFTVDPESDAKYPGGEQQLKQYIKANAIDKIPDSSFGKFDLAVVKFAINKKGQIIDAHIFETSKDKKTDELLLETISNMPNWKPAEYSMGIKVKQEFVFIVGNMESCLINLVNINPSGLSSEVWSKQ